MLIHPMRATWPMATVLIALMVTTACGWPTGRANPSTGPASGGRATTPASSPASGGRLTSPPAVACNPSSNTRVLSGPVAAYFWRSQDGCVTVSLVDAAGDLSTVTALATHAWQFTCQHDLWGGAAVANSGQTPGPAYSVTKDRIYWWDGHLIRSLDRGGNQGEVALDAGDQIGLEFAVSPDDARIVVTTIDFGRWPLHRTSWVEDFGTHANKSVIFEGDLPSDANSLNEGAPTGWPWGWQGARPVLYDFPVCALIAGDVFIAANHPRVVDPSSGTRIVTFPRCYGGTVTVGGVFCTTAPSTADNPFTARALSLFGWTGSQSTSWQLPYDTVACDSDLSPSGNRVLAYCEPNIYTQTQASTTRQFLFGAGPAVPPGIQQPVSLRWLDDDLVLESRTLSDPAGYRSAIYIWSLSRQATVAGPITIPGSYNRPRQWFNSAPPPTRLLA